MVNRIRFLIKTTLVGLFLLLVTPFAFASVTGYWQTIDGKTKQPSSVIEIAPTGSFYSGKVVKIFSMAPGEASPICTACKGAQRNKPILGLTIINGMICTNTKCSKGTILDPRDGKVYRATMRLAKGGNQLRVHGYIGVPLFGKTVTWQRVSQKILS